MTARRTHAHTHPCTHFFYFKRTVTIAKGGARFKGLTENGLDLEELEKEKLATMGDYDRPIADNDDEYVVTGQVSWVYIMIL